MTTAQKPVSLGCQGTAHMMCTDWDGCGCTVCHHICEACGSKCRAVYQLEAAGLEVCANCYKRMAPPPGKTTYCEICEHPSAYRHPGTGEERFLCAPCHVANGTPRRQDRNE